ncbi:MAG: methionyl-tRNA formyltransferase [Acidobacteria bacterium]|nr:methionyl-tRNA formyltransferase [Acidobacteriota bacterium]
MRIVFMGTPDFAVPSLSALLEAGEEVVAVVTQPDRPAGRGQKRTESPVKCFARRHDLHVLQPENIRQSSLLDHLAALEFDLLVVAAYGQILPQRLLDMPQIAPLNVHASLLPRYRGAAPIHWAVINGETETGITIMRIVYRLDAGDILCRCPETIQPEDTAGSLHDRLKIRGAECLRQALEAIRRGTATYTPQDESRVTHAPLLRREDARLDWSRPACRCHNFVRGMHPWPVAFTTFRGQNCKIHHTEPVESAPPEPLDTRPGQLDITTGRLYVRCGDGHWLRVHRLQLPDRTPVSGTDFINGWRPREEECFV